MVKLASSIALSIAFLFVSTLSAQNFQANSLYVVTRPHVNFAPGSLMRIGSDGQLAETVFTVPDKLDGLAFPDLTRVHINQLTNFTFGNLNTYSADGILLREVTGIPLTNRPGNGTAPRDLALDAAGNAYITTHNHPGATKVTVDGIASDWTGNVPELWWGRGAAFSPSGELFVVSSLGATPGETSALVQKIDTVTGAVQEIFNSLPHTEGIEFDSAGNMYLAQPFENQIVKVPAGTTNVVPFATITAPLRLALGPDGLLYAASSVSETESEIWSIDLTNGSTSLFADNLPFVWDLEFSPVPEPSSVVLLGLGAFAMMLFRSRRRTCSTPASPNSR